MAQEPADGRNMRVGDDERRSVDERLQRALHDGMLSPDEHAERAEQVWTSRTRGDLEPLTRDLPPEHPVEPAAPSPEPAGAEKPWRQRIAGSLGTALLVAVGALGAGAILTADDGAAVFGSKVLHVRDQDRVQVGTLFGSTEVVVPDDVRASTSGMTLFGRTECAQACQGDGVREVVVDARGAFGSVEVLTRAEFNQGGLDEDDADDD